MELKIKGFDELAEKLREKISKTENLEVVKHDIGGMIDSEVKRNFEEEKSPSGKKWEEWSDATKEYREKTSGDKIELGEKKLQKKGDLFKSLNYHTSRRGVVFGTLNQPIKYARIHQMGGKAGRGKKVTIPARPYIGLSERLKNKIKRYINDNT